MHQPFPSGRLRVVTVRDVRSHLRFDQDARGTLVGNRPVHQKRTNERRTSFEVLTTCVVVQHDTICGVALNENSLSLCKEDSHSTVSFELYIYIFSENEKDIQIDRGRDFCSSFLSTSTIFYFQREL